MMIKIKTNYRFLNIIQIYALTAGKDGNTLEEQYNEVGRILKTTSQGEINIVMDEKLKG